MMLFVLSYFLVSLKAMDIIGWSMEICTAPIWVPLLAILITSFFEAIQEHL